MVYVSTSCLKGRFSKYEKDLFTVLDVYDKLGFKNIELGSTLDKLKEDGLLRLKEWKKDHNTNFIIHGAFPPQEEPFFINLCSPTDIEKRSVDFIKHACLTAEEVGIDLIGFHSGYLADLSMEAKPISKKLERQIAFEKMVQNLGEVSDFAKERNIKLVIENNSAEINDVALLKLPSDFTDLLNQIRAKNLGILLDIGHLNSYCTEFNLDPREFIAPLEKHIWEMHCHKNEGKYDAHLPFEDDSLFNIFKKETLNQACLTLESHKLDGNLLTSCVNIMKRVKENSKI